MSKLSLLQQQQDRKIEDHIGNISCGKYLAFDFKTIDEVLESDEIAGSYKIDCLFCLIYHDKIALDDLEVYLKSYTSKRESNYKKLLCLYDVKKYK